MASKAKLSETEILEQDRVALENAVFQPEIPVVMSELRYDSAKINKAITLFEDEFHKTKEIGATKQEVLDRLIKELHQWKN